MAKLASKQKKTVKDQPGLPSLVFCLCKVSFRNEHVRNGTSPGPIAQVHIGPKHGGVGKCVPFPRGFVFQILSQLIFASRL